MTIAAWLAEVAARTNSAMSAAPNSAPLEQTLSSIRDSCLASRWDDVATHATEALAAAKAANEKLHQAQASAAALLTLPKAPTGASPFPLKGHAGWPQMAADAAARVTGPTVTPAKAAAAVAVVGQLTLPDLVARLGDIAAVVVDPLDELAFGYMRLRALAVLASAVAQFNRSGPAHPGGSIGDVLKPLGPPSQAMLDGFRNGKASAAADAARTVATKAETALREIVPFIVSSDARRPHRFALDRALDFDALNAAMSARQCLMYVVIGDVAAWTAGWGTATQAWQRWHDAAGLPATPQPAPLPAGVFDLAQHATKIAEGAQLSIVGTVTTTKVSGSAHGQAAVVDNEVNGPVIVFDKLARLDHVGLVPGAVASVAGRWRHSASVGGGPGLEVGSAVAMVYGPRGAFSAWAANEVARVTPVIPHDLAVECSWQKGSDGIANELEYSARWDPA